MSPLHSGAPRIGEHESGRSSVVERNLAKVDVVGSNPIARSQKLSAMCRCNAGVAQW